MQFTVVWANPVGELHAAGCADIERSVTRFGYETQDIEAEDLEAANQILSDETGIEPDLWVAEPKPCARKL